MKPESLDEEMSQQTVTPPSDTISHQTAVRPGIGSYKEERNKPDEFARFFDHPGDQPEYDDDLAEQCDDQGDDVPAAMPDANPPEQAETTSEAKQSDAGDIVANLIELLGNDVVLLSVPYPKKGSRDNEWSRFTIEKMADPDYRKSLYGENIAVSLGDVSGGLCTIDVDDDVFAEEFLKLNPRLRDTLRTKRVSGFNAWVRIRGERPRKTYYIETKTDVDWGEWRDNGGCTMIHGEAIDTKKGETEPTAYRYLNRVPPIEIEFNQIVWPGDLVLRWLDRASSSEGDADQPGSPGEQPRNRPSANEIGIALNHIPADCDYFTWLEIGMALHSWDKDEGLKLWDDWSQKSKAKYVEGEPAKKWKSFKQDGGITIATLFAEAKKNGYRPRPACGGANGGPANPRGATGPAADLPAFDMYYDAPRKEFLLKNGRGAWLSLTEAQVKKNLRDAGYRTSVQVNESLSPADTFLLNIRDRRDVDYSAPLAGYCEGFLEIGSTRVLVTQSPQFIDPAPGEWPTLTKLIENLLFDEQCDQRPYFFGWSKMAVESLRSGQLRPGQALAIAGPHDCGKSLLQQLITRMLGGRFAKPYQFMTGQTQFNADLFQAEHLMIEDECASIDIRSRRAFGTQIKNITANEGQRCHAKHRQPVSLRPFWRVSITESGARRKKGNVSLRPFWRVSITLNIEPENLMVLPPLDTSLEDKIIILRGNKKPMPMPTATYGQRTAFWRCLTAEIPAFLYFLAKWEIPAELRGERYGITHYHHPAILEAIDALTPEYRLLMLIDKEIFGKGDTAKWEGTAEELEGRLLRDSSSVRNEARRLFTFNTAAGTYLARLAKNHAGRVHNARKSDQRKWILYAEGHAPDGAEQ